jgi:two-component system NtrC family sensor kinase
MAHLCLLDEDGAVSQRWEIGDQPMAVGRSEAADVRIPDKLLSRHHFRIWREGADFLIKDLDSRNGTWVDGQRAEATKLAHDVCIVAGRSVFMFSEAGAPSVAACRRGARETPAP